MEEMFEDQRKKRKKGKKGKRGRRKRRRNIILSPAQRYEQAIALKRAIRCMLKVQDQYAIYQKLSEDFAQLAALPETDVFEGKDTCEALSRECKEKAEELKEKLPTKEEESRTVTTTAKQQAEKGEKKKSRAPWIVLGILIVVAGIVIAFRMDGSRYVIAAWEKAFGFQDMSTDTYRALGNYRDSEEKAAELEREMIAETRRGGSVAFGDSDWIVLAKKKDAVCIMKKEGISEIAFHDTQEEVSWETSSLRTYLNSVYLNEFTQAERKYIRLTEVASAENKEYHTPAGNLTKDYVYILSADEVKKYREALENTGKNMRLRNPGKEGMATAYVSGLGETVLYGYPVSDTGVLVYPVLWISLP